MTLKLTLSTQAEARLRERAAAAGEDPAEHALRILEAAVSEPTLDELLAPFRQQVAESGAPDEELQALFTQARDRARLERRGRADSR